MIQPAMVRDVRVSDQLITMALIVTSGRRAQGRSGASSPRWRRSAWRTPVRTAGSVTYCTVPPMSNVVTRER